MAPRAVRALDEKQKLAAWWGTTPAVWWTRKWLERAKEDYQRVIISHEQHIRHLHHTEKLLRGYMDKGEDELDLVEQHNVEALTRYFEESKETNEFLRKALDGYSYDMRVLRDYGVEEWAKRNGRFLHAAEAYWVAKPMASLVDSAYPSMPEQPLTREDLPCDHGFALIDGDATLATDWPPAEDVSGFTAVSWAVTTRHDGEPGVLVTWWWKVGRDHADDPDVKQSVRNSGTTIFPISHHWTFGTTEPGMTTSVDDGHSARWVAAFWNLLGRPLVAQERERPDRATRRRAERAGMTDPAVTVITLRSPKSKGTGEPRTVDWKSRWLVRGFWRQQWYPSLGQHRALWVDSYIKGPADRPLRIKEHVYAWTR